MKYRNSLNRKKQNQNKGKQKPKIRNKFKYNSQKRVTYKR